MEGGRIGVRRISSMEGDVLLNACLWEAEAGVELVTKRRGGGVLDRFKILESTACAAREGGEGDRGGGLEGDRAEEGEGS